MKKREIGIGVQRTSHRDSVCFTTSRSANKPTRPCRGVFRLIENDNNTIRFNIFFFFFFFFDTNINFCA